MNLYAWLISATGLPDASVWEAYQNSAHEPPYGTDYVTYDVVGAVPQVYLSYQYDVPDAPAPVPEDVTLTHQSETPTTVTLRVFGESRVLTAQAITQAAHRQAPSLALLPAVYQRVVPGTYRRMRLQREFGWMEWVQFDVLIHDSVTTSEVVPTIQGSEITGEVGDMPVEVIEP